MKVLDLYCCQGGATRGYQSAGFQVIGIDLTPQPRYVGEWFRQCDAIEWVGRNVEWIKANITFIHASPPCQRYSATQRIQDNDHPDLIAPTREILNHTGVPWVIENVEEASRELIEPVMLCGASFGLHTYRHRLFEAGGWDLEPPAHLPHTSRTVKMGRPLVEGDWYHAVGNFSNVPYVRRDMGMEWASRDGLREAIPPAYAEYVGKAFLSSGLADSR